MGCASSAAAVAPSPTASKPIETLGSCDFDKATNSATISEDRASEETSDIEASVKRKNSMSGGADFDMLTKMNIKDFDKEIACLTSERSLGPMEEHTST